MVTVGGCALVLCAEWWCRCWDGGSGGAETAGSGAVITTLAAITRLCVVIAVTVMAAVIAAINNIFQEGLQRPI